MPAWLVCAPAGGGIACRDLNGDEHVPVGSSIYAAVPAPGWRRAPAGAQPPAGQTARMMRAIFGGPLTPAESRLLQDFLAAPTVSGGSSGPARAAAPPAR